MDKERITITISPVILKAVDLMVDGKTIRNRSHAIETLISQSLGATTRDALILAGGGGTAKAMTIVNGKPVVARTVDWLVRNGIKNITFCVDKRDKKIREYFGEGIGFNAIYKEEAKPLGTGGTLANLSEGFKSTFVVCFGDIVTDFDLPAMISFHKRHKATLTVALTSVHDTKAVGIAHLDGARITAFNEKPDKAETHLANAGVYVMEPEIFSYLSSRRSLEREVIPRLIEESKCFGYTFSGPWIDIAKPGGKEKAKKMFK